MVSEILSSTEPCIWRWVPTGDNPSDDATRMSGDHNFDPTSQWLKGSKYLVNEENKWPVNAFYCPMRIMAWVLRFVKRCRRVDCCRQLQSFSSSELFKTTRTLCLQTQKCAFSVELKMLEDRHPMPTGSPLYVLSPYIDNNGLVRVSGCLYAASWLNNNTKRSLILPTCNAFSELLIKEAHKKMKHQNFEATMCEIRQSYWIPRLRQNF